jgi:RNA polymerase sigma-70 factor (ECF subfamily)
MNADDELAERLRAGDENALRAAYDRHAGAVLYLAQRLLGNRSDAEDVTQLTFVAAWAGRETFDPQRGTMLSWLLGIARRKVVDRLRSAARDHRITATMQAQLPPSQDRRRNGSSTGSSWRMSWPGCLRNSGARLSSRSSTI